MTRVLALGLDGADWAVLAPLADDLPYLDALRRLGASGDLAGVAPTTPAASSGTLLSGREPHDHGVVDLVRARVDGALVLSDQADLLAPPLGVLLAQAGRHSVIVNPTLQHAVAPPGGIVINRFDTDAGRRISPPALEQRYRRLLDACPVAPAVSPADPGEFAGDLARIESARFDLARELFLAEPWDLFMLSVSGLDWYLHAHGGAVRRGDEAAVRGLRTVVRAIDSSFGWLVEHAPDAVLVAVSCFGFEPEQAIARPNVVLGQAGLGVPVEAARARRWFGRGGGGRRRLAPRAALAADGVVTIVVDDDEAARIAHDALAALVVAGGEPAFDRIDRTEQSLIVYPRPGTRVAAATSGLSWEPASGEAGCRSSTGLLVLGGPMATAGQLVGARLLDVAPTILWALEVAAPPELRGRPLLEAYEPAYVSRKPAPRLHPASAHG